MGSEDGWMLRFHVRVLQQRISEFLWCFVTGNVTKNVAVAGLSLDLCSESGHSHHNHE